MVKYAVSIYVSKKIGRYPIMAKGGTRVLTYKSKKSAQDEVKRINDRGTEYLKPKVITEKDSDFRKPMRLFKKYKGK